MKRVGAAVCALVLLAVSAAAETATTTSYRYRLSLEVDVGGETKSGTSVVEVIIKSPRRQGPRLTQHRANGEATLVEFGDGRALVALLAGEPALARSLGPLQRVWMGLNPSNILIQVYGAKLSEEKAGKSGPREEHLMSLGAVIRQRDDARELAPDQLPTLLGFKNLKDPRTVVLVDPRDPASALGADVKLRRATIAITDAPVTRSLETKLDWLPQIGDHLDGKFYCDLKTAKESGWHFCPHRNHFTRSDR